MRRAKATKRSEIAPIVSFLPAPRPSFVGPLCRALSDCQTCRSEEHTSELQSPCNLVCRLLLEKKKNIRRRSTNTPHPLPHVITTTQTPIYGHTQRVDLPPATLLQSTWLHSSRVLARCVTLVCI